MAYTPKTWECGETITADELNRMEEGIANASSSGGGTAPLIINLIEREATQEECPEGGGSVLELDKTWREINDAFPNAFLVDSSPLGVYKTQVGAISYRPPNEFFVGLGVGVEYITDEENGYPSLTACGEA